MILAEVDRARTRVRERTAPVLSRDPPVLEPGVMRLTAVRDRPGGIVDFVWVSGNAAAARMMYCAASQLPGKRLSSGVAGPLGHPVLIDRYRRVIEHGNAQSFAQVHLLDGTQDLVDHRVVRDGDSVVVTLTNLSAERRARERRLHIEVWARQAAPQLRPEPPSVAPRR
jgi:hypothetical protein